MKSGNQAAVTLGMFLRLKVKLPKLHSLKCYLTYKLSKNIMTKKEKTYKQDTCQSHPRLVSSTNTKHAAVHFIKPRFPLLGPDFPTAPNKLSFLWQACQLIQSKSSQRKKVSHITQAPESSDYNINHGFYPSLWWILCQLHSLPFDS